MALTDLSNGAPVQELEKALKYYETLEDYEACAGILKAIKEVKDDTLTAIKKKIHEFNRNKKSS
jgi:hypothetical protein